MPNVDVDPPPWSSGLPPAVLRRLPSHADRVRFAASCRPWRAAASSTSHHQPPDPPPLPWLALPATGAFLSFPCSDETTSVKLPGAAAARYHGSCDDWLVFNHNYEEEYLLLNPFSGATARLPPLSRARNVVRHPREGTALEPVDVIRDDGRAPPNASVRKMAIVVTRPGRDRDRKAVVVVVVAIIGDKASGKVAACRLDGGGDGAGFWVVRAHEQWRALSDMAVHDGKVHVVDEGGDLYVVGVEEDERTGAPVITSLGRPVARAASAPAVASRHLVASGGKLLMVATRAGDGAFAVFEVDRRSARWKQVWSVGDDVVLFVGPWSSVARSVAPYEMRGNVIYFLDDDGRVGGYDMRDGKTTYNLSPAVPHGGGDTPATWLFSRGEPERGLTLCDVPSDVLAQQVLDRLPRHDQLSLRQVCRCLRGAVQQHCPPRRPPQGQAPAYLVRPDGTVFIHPDLTSLYLHDVAGYRGAACDGWLLFHDDDEGSLLRLKNLFTGRTRLLPSLRDMVVLPGGAVAVLLGRDRLSKLALCSSTSSSSAWAMSARDAWRRYEDMALCGGRLYALTTAEDLIAFDVITGTRDGEGGGGGPAVSRVELAIMGGYATPHHHDDGPVARYLVGSRATTTTMFMVRRPLRLAEGETAPRLEVFRADLASMRWEEVTTTLSGGDDEEEGVALFVGRLCSRAVRVRGGGGDAVLRGDRVFFLPDDAAGPSSYFLHRVAVYDMRDGTVMELPKLKLWRDAPAPATWLFPEDDSPL
ncbi:hypothetical protein PR202_ga01506 [Eleusine coracana subsp. coracana]|uniref:DUF295 domain-containing protein n=1 Tax=Eleusine coracana subsp. coracana TaxID=191504 RepID=A0AAV5BHI1_ELECO|nr:hypothetical protein PR202_ga00819 [Eleusine coracana subsp. coracana]GJM85713.1 hypothetical protein PR202_ga01506 [Eleusine coracana subsp. coracana]